MPDDLTSFKDLAHRVNYAHKNTQRQYDKYPPNDDMVPIAAAIIAWTLVCGWLYGHRADDEAPDSDAARESRENILKRTHNLECLYELLDPSERKVVAHYYRVYRSLHNFATGNITLETADEFIQHIGKGYTTLALHPGRRPRARPRLTWD